MKRLFLSAFLLGGLYSVGYAQSFQDSLKDVINFGKYIGIGLTETEADSLLGNLRSQKRNILQLHAAPVPNHLPYPFAFHPHLGKKLPTKRDAVQSPLKDIPVSKKVNLPSNINALAFYSIPELASLLRQKKITSVELTEFFLNRLKQYKDTLYCVISLTDSIAMVQARQADRELQSGKDRGLLHGIPYGLKDLFFVKGTKTTFGALPFKDQDSEIDAFVYKQLRDAGAVLCAKLSMGELAYGDRWFGGLTRNPWDLHQGSSGSSAGSASAVAAGLLPFAIGTETHGSIISPSIRCGTVGLRPSFGAVARTGAMVLSWSLDKIGPICRNVQDAAIVYSYIKGADEADPSSVDYAFRYVPPKAIGKLNIGYAENYYRNVRPESPSATLLKDLEKEGIKLLPAVFPDSGIYDSGLMSIIISVESAAAFDELTRTNQDDLLVRQDKAFWPNSFRAARFIPAVEYINANRHRYTLTQKVNRFMEDYDVLILPGPTGASLAITNLTGHPMISLPIGLGENGKPVSIILMGKLYGEAEILAVAEKIQQITAFHKNKPPIFKP